VGCFPSSNGSRRTGYADRKCIGKETAGLLGCVIDQAMMDRVQREFEAVGNTELVEDIVQVILDGLLGDEEFFANFLVAKALCDELDDFLFPVAQERLFAARAGLGRFCEGLHHFGGHTIVEPDFAGVDAVNTFDEKIGGGLLEHDAASAEAHGADHIAIVFGGGKHDDAGGNRIEIHFFEHGEAVFFRHAQIEQQNIGLEFGEQLDALRAILRFADDGDVFVAVDKFAEAIAKDRVVVGHENSNLLFGLRHNLNLGR